MWTNTFTARWKKNVSNFSTLDYFWLGNQETATPLMGEKTPLVRTSHWKSKQLARSTPVPGEILPGYPMIINRLLINVLGEATSILKIKLFYCLETRLSEIQYYSHLVLECKVPLIPLTQLGDERGQSSWKFFYKIYISSPKCM